MNEEQITPNKNFLFPTPELLIKRDEVDKRLSSPLGFRERRYVKGYTLACCRRVMAKNANARQTSLIAKGAAKSLLIDEAWFFLRCLLSSRTSSYLLFGILLRKPMASSP
uniref:Transposase n=1 Tax=Loa loa TaxID=7209 RepID=A0A1I7VV98_LOALO